jgi:hypothetical protein
MHFDRNGACRWVHASSSGAVLHTRVWYYSIHMQLAKWARGTLHAILWQSDTTDPAQASPSGTHGIGMHQRRCPVDRWIDPCARH